MKPNVLFVCTHNSARSQMAEAWLRHLAGDRYKAYSAGIESTGVHPLAVTAMKEVGVDMTDHRSKTTEEYLGKLAVTYLMVVCDRAAEQCPSAWPGVRMRFFWPFTDPSKAEGTDEEKLVLFRQVRDEIKAKIENWLTEIEDPKPRETAAN